MKLSLARRNRSAQRCVKAFTLMEILLVIGLLGLLMGVMAVGFGDIFFQNEQQIARMFVQQGVKANLQQYRMNMGSYPTSDEGLKALMEAPEGDKASRWKGPYADSLPKDPWGHPYEYACPGTHNKTGYDLWSAGPDGQDGTGDDIGNWGE
ncbi:MAG TPA: type II secretion system major pseudopilin GspG [Opitutales bacterium]|nr:type II secretion system major pseudopilin GspG [Opitutales bacterium]